MNTSCQAAVLLLLLSGPAEASPSSSGDPLDQARWIPRINVGPLVVSDDHPVFDFADFSVKVDSAAIPVEARWMSGSTRWVRGADGLAVPLARLRVSVRAAPERVALRWRDRAILLQGGPDEAFTELFVPLLDGGEARLDLDGRPLTRVRVGARVASATLPAARHAIDHSCSPWRVTIAGLDDSLLSMNCRLILTGRIGSEEPLLDVRWAAAGVSLPGGSMPMTAQLRSGQSAKATVLGPDGKSRVVEISARLAPRWRRLRLAYGLGPYGLSSSAPTGNGTTGSVMLYANFRLRPEDNLSLRSFEAAVSQSPLNTVFFNNLGLYFAYDLARVLDQRLLITAMLGMQGVTFAPQGLSRKIYNEILFPQGLEATYVDAFGKKNRTLSGGMFLQPTTNKHYHNIWLRYGGRWFGELNYISWRSYDRSARMWGVSIGAPLAQLF
ncbi:MAG: hypothetical protein HYZ74_04815 [Elusimicrobia bacterium]|nr:hypothetical protein [Elusimicrobiota bacterium]